MTGIAIIGSGLVTAVGFNAASSCAAMRAGLSGIASTPLVDSESGDDLCGGKVSLPQWSVGLDKLADLVAPAISECLRAAAPELPDRIPLFLGVAEPGYPCRLERLEGHLLEEVEFRLGLSHHPESGVIPLGHVAPVHGLLAAQRLIHAGRATKCIVAGVHSYLHQDVIEVYLDERRLMTATNSNGFFPGEAGSAVLVGGSLQESGAQLEILGIGTAQEAATIGSDKPLRAEGLTSAIRQACQAAGLGMGDMAYRITDLTGEHYKFKEAAFAIARFEDRARTDIFEMWHPVEFIGEVGGAILPCMLAVALHAGQKGYAPGDTALCHVGSEDGQRAALVVRYNNGRVKR